MKTTMIKINKFGVAGVLLGMLVLSLFIITSHYSSFMFDVLGFYIDSFTLAMFFFPFAFLFGWFFYASRVVGSVLIISFSIFQYYFIGLIIGVIYRAIRVRYFNLAWLTVVVLVSVIIVLPFYFQYRNASKEKFYSPPSENCHDESWNDLSSAWCILLGSKNGYLMVLDDIKKVATTVNSFDSCLVLSKERDRNYCRLAYALMTKNKSSCDELPRDDGTRRLPSKYDWCVRAMKYLADKE